MKYSLFKRFIALVMLSQLSACASFDFLKSKISPQQTIQQSKLPPNWQATLPHDGDIKHLQDFWQQYDDTLLLDLINAAQQVSPTIAAAESRIAQARADRISTNANTLPKLDASASATRSKQSGGNGQNTNVGGVQTGSTSGAYNTQQMNLQAAWELDLLGVYGTLTEAAKRRESAAKSGWHDARVSVASEVATSYFNQRYCQQQLLLNLANVKSNAETVKVTELLVKAGFSTKDSLSLAQAVLADAQQQSNAQQAQCDVGLKELVALTAWDEPSLKAKLTENAFKELGANTLFTINDIPAKVIAQRPDIDNAEAELMTAAANVQSAKGQRLPRVSLNGAIGWSWISGAGFSTNGETWSLGPLTVTLPIYDGGKLKANQASAEVKYAEAASNYRDKLRQAVKEVEAALVNLHSTQMRETEIVQAIQGYQANVNATEVRVKAGFANLLELEQSRRNALQAQTNLINVHQARNNAWISLYRAAGGGWQTNNAEVVVPNKD